MKNNPEYLSHSQANLPTDPEKALRARNAMVRLVTHFYFSPSAKNTVQGQIEAARRLHMTIKEYNELSVRAAERGITKEDRKIFIKDGLKAKSLIDRSDPSRANDEYTIISEGYELNWKHWNEKLRGVRGFTDDFQRYV